MKIGITYSVSIHGHWFSEAGGERCQTHRPTAQFHNVTYLINFHSFSLCFCFHCHTYHLPSSVCPSLTTFLSTNVCLPMFLLYLLLPCCLMYVRLYLCYTSPSVCPSLTTYCCLTIVCCLMYFCRFFYRLLLTIASLTLLCFSFRKKDRYLL